MKIVLEIPETDAETIADVDAWTIVTVLRDALAEFKAMRESAVDYVARRYDYMTEEQRATKAREVMARAFIAGALRRADISKT